MTSAFIMTFEVDGDAAEAYDQVIEDMELEDRMPTGGVWHYAGPYEGGWRVIDVWENEAAYERFAEEKIGPIAGRHGFSPPRVERIPVDDVGDGAAGEAHFLQVVRMPFDGDTFHALDSKVRPGGEPPADLVHHINGPGADGTWVVIDSWTSKEARDRFLESRVFPNVPEGGPRPTLEDLEVHNTMT
jgi:quinol monooxygenase YgiN